jgi:hypothetical protein
MPGTAENLHYEYHDFSNPDKPLTKVFVRLTMGFRIGEEKAMLQAVPGDRAMPLFNQLAIFVGAAITSSRAGLLSVNLHVPDVSCGYDPRFF